MDSSVTRDCLFSTEICNLDKILKGQYSQKLWTASVYFTSEVVSIVNET